MFVFFQLLGCFRWSCRGATAESAKGGGSGNHHGLERVPTSHYVQLYCTCSQSHTCIYTHAYIYIYTYTYIFVYMLPTFLGGHCWWNWIGASWLKLRMCQVAADRTKNSLLEAGRISPRRDFANAGFSEKTHTYIYIYIYLYIDCTYIYIYIKIDR